MKCLFHDCLVAGLAVFLVQGCKATKEESPLPRFPYPDGGLADVFRKPMADTAAPGLDTPVDGFGSIDAPADLASLHSDADREESGDALAACRTSCDDNNPCTIDTCDVKTGTCANRLADENSACESSCLKGGKGTCQLGVCKGSPADDGTGCDDHNPCTVNDSCKAGVCYSGTEKPCLAADSCHEIGHCDRATGQCVEVRSNDGKSCDDRLTCTVGDRCTQGVCGGFSLDCTSGAVCSEPFGICKSNDRTAFPSGTVAAAWNGVNFGVPGTLAMGPSQEPYVVGTLFADTDLGTGTIKKVGTGYDLLVAKVNPATGQAAWVKTFGDDRDQSGTAIVANTVGQVALSGFFGGTMTFGSKTIVSPAGDSVNQNAFVAAVDAATGAGLWAMRPMVNGAGMALAADSTSGDFVACGTASSQPAIGFDAKATSADEGEIVVARLKASSGDVVWGRQINAPGYQTCDSVAFDASGNLFLAGTMSSVRAGSSTGKVDFGSGVSVSPPSGTASGTVTVIWVAGLNMANGKGERAFAFGGKGLQVIQKVACDASGNVIVAGGFSNRMLLGKNDVLAGDEQNAFVAKLDGSLTPLWLDSWSSAGTTLASQVTAEPAGTLMVAGSYTGSLTLGRARIAVGEPSGTSGFVARLDASGAVLNVRGYGGPNSNQQSTGLRIVASGADAGAIWYAGGFTGTLQLGPPVPALKRLATTASATGALEGMIGFVAKIAP